MYVCILIIVLIYTDLRIIISEKYVRFHEDAEAVNNEHEALELLLKEAKGEDRGTEVEAKWEQVQKQYLDLCNTGKEFCQYVRNVSIKCLCIQEVFRKFYVVSWIVDFSTISYLCIEIKRS